MQFKEQLPLTATRPVTWHLAQASRRVSRYLLRERVWAGESLLDLKIPDPHQNISRRAILRLADRERGAHFSRLLRGCLRTWRVETWRTVATAKTIVSKFFYLYFFLAFLVFNNFSKFQIDWCIFRFSTSCESCRDVSWNWLILYVQIPCCIETIVFVLNLNQI